MRRAGTLGGAKESGENTCLGGSERMLKSTPWRRMAEEDIQSGGVIHSGARGR